MTLANGLTLLRIVLIPFFITALILERAEWALGSFALAGVTDVLDGYVARRTRVTELGTFLDPLADKLLLVSAFIVLPLVTSFPIWISIIVVSRDVIIALGYGWFVLRCGSKVINVRVSGKITTLLQSLCVGVALLGMMVDGLAFIQNLLGYSVAIITIISGVDYIWHRIKKHYHINQQRV